MINFGTILLHYAEVNIPMELGAEVNIKSPNLGAEVTRAEHRLPPYGLFMMGLSFYETKEASYHESYAKSA